MTLKEKNFTQSSTENHTSHDARANNSKRSRNKKSMIIVSDSMTKLLNGWEIGKLILHVGTNDLSSEKSSVDIAKSKII